MRQVQLSIGKLAVIMIALLITLTVVTTTAGFYVLQANFRTLEERHDAEAHDTLRIAAISIRNQIRFYQGILHLISTNNEVGNLLEFGQGSEVADWSHTVGRLLPGTLGTALASPQGVVFGDALALRVGPACQEDLQHFSAGQNIDYPLLHNDIAGLEHFDLLARIVAPSGEQAGTLFVSFRLSVLEDLLESMTFSGDRFFLLDGQGVERLSTSAPLTDREVRTYRSRIPDTSWELVLQRPAANGSAFVSDLIVADILVLLAVSVLMVAIVRVTHGRFTSDMRRVHQALEDVLRGRYKPSDKATAIKETAILLPDIEQLALRIQQQRNELRQQSLSDPLTGVFNRRYFDLMLGHLHEQSRRQHPSALIIVDLNDFKHINDEFGHSAGDRVLQHIAAYLKSRVRATDIVARLGGDEFALIMTNMAERRLDEWLTALIHDHDHKLLEGSDGTVCVCQISIGAAYIDAQVYPQPSDVFKAADSAMYSVKQRRQIRHSRFAIARRGHQPDNVTPLTSASGAP